MKENRKIETTVQIKECSSGSLSKSIENGDFLIYHKDTDTTIRFKSLTVANEFYEKEVSV